MIERCLKFIVMLLLIANLLLCVEANENPTFLLESISFSAAEQQEFVDRHNEQRRKEPAQNMNEIKFDPDLASEAVTIAGKCNLSHINDGYGQNFFAADSSGSPWAPTVAVDSWHSEAAAGLNGTCVDPEQCHHYKQLIWAGSTKLGCGAAICEKIYQTDGSLLFGGSNSTIRIEVCNYDKSPALNDPNEFPFEYGVRCCGCSAEYPGCHGYLCSTDGTPLTTETCSEQDPENQIITPVCTDTPPEDLHTMYAMYNHQKQDHLYSKSMKIVGIAALLEYEPKHAIAKFHSNILTPQVDRCCLKPFNRRFNRSDTDHVYGINATELQLLGLFYDGPGGRPVTEGYCVDPVCMHDCASRCNATEAINVYYNSELGDHMYITSDEEKSEAESAGYKFEKIECYAWAPPSRSEYCGIHPGPRRMGTLMRPPMPESSTTTVLGDIANSPLSHCHCMRQLHLLHNPTTDDYMLTSKYVERKTAMSESYKNLNIQGYCAENLGDCEATKPLYKLYSEDLQPKHFYTTDENEKSAKIANGYADEGIECYIW